MSKTTDTPFIIYGRNPVKEYLKTIKSGKLLILNSIQQQNPASELIRKALSKNITVEYKDKSELTRIAGTGDHQGVVLSVTDSFNTHFTETDFSEWLNQLDKRATTVLILDGIKDPGNLGAILRSAYLFDADLVILPKDHSASINEVVMKRSAGAAAFVKTLYVTNLVRIIDDLKQAGFWIYGTDMNGQDIKLADFSQRHAVIMGDEGDGIRPLVRKNCDQMIRISTNQKLDSLNVSVSAGIILSDLFQRFRSQSE
jgi:23S rRNA (guanosine2251-2'-O)-methyltransferase